MEHRLERTNAAVSAQIRTLRQEIGREFGAISRIVSRALGPVLLWSARREERRLAAGHTYEPPMIIQRRNWTADQRARTQVAPIYVHPRSSAAD